MNFKIQSKYKPAGDQPQAIQELVDGVNKNYQHQTLLGVTGSGKTFTIANVVERTQLPTLVIAHNKTLAAQLCNEFRELFPDNRVEYFVSYYDYYQPEAYLPPTDTYIEKEAQINEEIDRLRHACTEALLTRKDVIIVASVSAIYGLGSPKEYEEIVLKLEVGQKLDRRGMLEHLIAMQFTRTNVDLKRGTFRLKGQIFEIMPINEEKIYRFEISDQINSIEIINPVSRKFIGESRDAWFFPAKHYVVPEGQKQAAFKRIEAELKEQLNHFDKKKKILAYERLKRRTKYDLAMIKNIGYCSGIENYSRHFDGRRPGEPPYSLIDYFLYGNDRFLTVIDESHITVPQIRGMFAGDKSRKDTLIEHGFRLPSARDNRPLTFEEFNNKIKQTIYVSATPSEYETRKSDQIVEQIIRPTGLIDPEVIIQGVTGDKTGHKLSQVEDLIKRITDRVNKKERVLVTTLTKRTAEDLADYLKSKGIKVNYLHSEVLTLDRVEIITDLRKGKYDVIVGVNLLREGLDLPEVSLVAVLDADKEGFLRNETSLIQTIGRAARNVNGQVILYADKITDSIKNAMRETDRRRRLQLDYNKKNNITPKTIEKNIRNILEEFGISADKKTRGKVNARTERIKNILAMELPGEVLDLDKVIKEKSEQMRQAAKELEFELAAVLRDEIRELKNQRNKRS